MFQKLRRGQIVAHTPTKRTGKVIGFEGANTIVEVIVSKNEVTGDRTTRLESFLTHELVPVNPKKDYRPYLDVMEFHRKFNHPVANEPTPMAVERAKQRTDYLVEEVVEFLWASVAGNQLEFSNLVGDLMSSIVKAEAKCNEKGSFPQDEILLHQTDALNDINYINYGTMVETGVNPKPVFEIIHAANMAKLDANGQPILHPITNKIMKPEGWEENYQPEPLIKKEIERQKVIAKKKRAKYEGKSYGGN